MNAHRIIITIAALALLASPAVAEKEAPPPAGEPEDFQLPEIHELTLDNGMRATLVPHGRAPKVDVRLVVRTGSIDETADQVWLADLLAALMLEGAGDRTADEIAQAAATMGGSVDTNASADHTYVGGSSLSEFVPEMIGLVADVVRRPRLPGDQLARLEADLRRRLSIARSRQRTLARERFVELMFGEHPYGRLLPTPEMISGYTIEQLRAFYDQHVGAARAHLYVAGRFDREKVEQAVREAFGDWDAGPAFEPDPPTTTEVDQRRIYLVDREGAVQSSLFIGVPVVDPAHPDWIPLMVTNAILGGSFTSRITSNLREDKGYTYSPRSTLRDYYRTAYWAEIADVTTEFTGPSLKEIFDEIELLRREAPTADELRSVQSFLAGIFILRNSGRSGLIDELQFVDTHGLGDDYLRTYVERVTSVTPEQVREMARKYLDPAHMLVVVAGDADAIRDQVSAFGDVVERPD